MIFLVIGSNGISSPELILYGWIRFLSLRITSVRRYTPVVVSAYASVLVIGCVFSSRLPSHALSSLWEVPRILHILVNLVRVCEPTSKSIDFPLILSCAEVAFRRLISQASFRPPLYSSYARSNDQESFSSGRTPYPATERILRKLLRCAGLKRKEYVKETGPYSV